MQPNIELEQEDISQESSHCLQKVVFECVENENHVKSSESVKHCVENESEVKSPELVKPAKDIVIENNKQCESIYPSIGVQSASIQNQCHSETETPLNIEKTDNKIKSFVERTMIKSVYPDLKSIQYCEKVEDITSIQTLVKTYTEEYLYKTYMEATKHFQEFHTVCYRLICVPT